MTVQGRMGRGRRTALAIVVVALLAWLGLRGHDAQPPEQPARGESDVPEAAAVAGPSSRPPSGQAGNSPALKRCMDDMQDVLRKRTAELATRQDARSQLAYALTSNMLQKHRPDHNTVEDAARLMAEQQQVAMQAFARAQKLDPAHPDIAWLAAESCFQGPDCSSLQHALLVSEPDNAAVWLNEMTWARMRSDGPGVERAFERASKADGYDRHRGAVQLIILEAFSGVGMPMECGDAGVQSDLRRFMPGKDEFGPTDLILMLSSNVAAIQLPAYSDISRHCKPDASSPQDLERRSACVRILEKLAGGDTLMEQSIALSLLVPLAVDGPDAAHWRERYRNHQWMLSQAMTPAFQGLTLEDYALDELRSMQQALQAAGRWPAPDGWLPRDATARSLIQTGRPPPPKPR